MGRLKGKSAIVTGGTSGIGKATVLKLIEEGAKVIIADIHEGDSEEMLKEIQRNKGEAEFCQMDVSSHSDVKSAIEKCIKSFGSLDIMIANAGIGGSATFFEDITVEEWNKVIAVNQTGVFYCMQESIKIMKKQGSGAIVNTASLAGIGSAPRMGAYAASKHAVVGMTKTAAAEYGKHGIRINAICPSVIVTPMGKSFTDEDDKLSQIIKHSIPMKRFGEAEEVADVILWLCSDESSFVNGETVRIDGGHRA